MGSSLGSSVLLGPIRLINDSGDEKLKVSKSDLVDGTIGRPSSPDVDPARSGYPSEVPLFTPSRQVHRVAQHEC